MPRRTTHSSGIGATDLLAAKAIPQDEAHASRARVGSARRLRFGPSGWQAIERQAPLPFLGATRAW